MSDRTINRWKGHLVEAVKYAIIGSIIGLLLGSIPGVSDVFSTVERQASEQLSYAIQVWTDATVINSATSYALNAIILVTILSALTNSFNRDSPSPVITGILTAPGIGIWAKIVVWMLDKPFLGNVVYGIGGALRIYLWIGSLILYLVYPVVYVLNAEASLLIVTVSTILASASFGAIFGSFEKGLVMSMKSIAKDIRENELREQSIGEAIISGTILPASLWVAIYITRRGVTSLRNPTTAEFLTTSSSIFIATFLATLLVLYFVIAIVLVVISGKGVWDSYTTEKWTVRQKIKSAFAEYVESELQRGDKDKRESGYPDEVKEALRRDRSRE